MYCIFKDADPNKLNFYMTNKFDINELSHNNPCFQCNIAITNFLVLYTYQIRFDDVIGQSSLHIPTQKF